MNRSALAVAAGAVVVPLALLADRPVSTAAHMLHRPAIAVLLTHIADAALPLAIAGGAIMIAATLGALGLGRFP